MKHLLTLGLLLTTVVTHSNDEKIELTEREFKDAQCAATLRNVTLTRGKDFEELCYCASEAPTEVLKIIHDGMRYIDPNKYIHKEDFKKICTPRPGASTGITYDKEGNQDYNKSALRLWIRDQSDQYGYFTFDLTSKKGSAKHKAICEVLNFPE